MSKPKKVAAPAVEQPATKTKLSIKELLERSKYAPVSLLRSKTITLPLTDAEDLEIKLRQLTKREYDILNKKISKDMPTVPMVEQTYAVARRNPTNGEVKPAGTYKEPNPQDPQYLQETQDWFNEACVWLAIFSAGDDFGFNFVTTPEAELDELLNEKFVELSKMFATPTLLDLAVEAAYLNRGIHLAEQLIDALQEKEAKVNLQEILEQIKSSVGETPVEQ